MIRNQTERYVVLEEPDEFSCDITNELFLSSGLGFVYPNVLTLPSLFGLSKTFLIIVHDLHGSVLLAPGESFQHNKIYRCQGFIGFPLIFFLIFV